MLNHCKRIALTVLAALPFLAQAAPKHLEPFGQQTWQQFQTALPRPSVIVFTTTDCAHCPAVIKKMAQEITQRKAKEKVPLIVVVMDGEGNQELVRDAHYAKADRLFGFSGQVPALQYSVNPKWRGVTPYVALFPSSGAPAFITGSPAAHEIRAWLTEKK